MVPTLIHQINGVAMGTVEFFSFTSIDFVSRMSLIKKNCFAITIISNTQNITHNIGLDNEYIQVIVTFK